jgi:glycosyltransferase involved in cell wall biosynthesis
MKTILIDGSVLSRQIASGISNYLINIYEYFKRYEDHYNILTRTVTPGKIPYENIFLKSSGLSKEEEFSCISYPEFIGQMIFGTGADCDLYHSPYMFLPPRRASRKNVLTVHDLINIKNSDGLNGQIRKQLLKKAIDRADYFICISLATKAELLALFPNIHERQIFVIFQGIDKSFFAVGDSRSPDTSKKKPYLLYVGQRSGYKNFNAVINLMSATSISDKMDLLCVGGGTFSDAEKKQFEQAGVSNAVHHAGYIDINALRDVYTNAVALIYPSLEEGFGLPIIEAMACSCPVVTGNFSSMKEIAGSHGILVSDYSVGSLNEGIQKALTLSTDQKKSAKEYASNFTWEKTALETLQAYVSILSH